MFRAKESALPLTVPFRSIFIAGMPQEAKRLAAIPSSYDSGMTAHADKRAPLHEASSASASAVCGKRESGDKCAFA